MKTTSETNFKVTTDFPGSLAGSRLADWSAPLAVSLVVLAGTMKGDLDFMKNVEDKLMLCRCLKCGQQWNVQVGSKQWACLSCHLVQYVGVRLEVVRAMRDWASDCDWLDGDELNELSDLEIVRGIEKHYAGGVAQFVKDCAPPVAAGGFIPALDGE